MKTIKKISAMAFAMMFIGMGTTFAGGTAGEVKIKTSMQCDMCKERITKALSFEKGVKEIKVNLETKEVTVMYNPKKTSSEKIRLAISKAGYDADEVKADAKAYNKLPKCCQKGGHE